MEFLCLAPSSHNFTTSPKLTPFSTNPIITTTTLRDMKMYRNMRGSRVKTLVMPLKLSNLWVETLTKPLKLSNLFYPSDNLVSDPSSLPKPGQLIEHQPTGGNEEELLQYLLDILGSPVYDVAIESPLEKAEKISKKLGVNFFIKREDKQSVFSFKVRGAYNMMSRLPEEQLRKGIITASAGNHAQGVALSASRLGCPATIVMPTTTPQIRIDAIKSLNPGAWVPLMGENFDEALAIALEWGDEKGLTFIPPYDDPEIIKGQGTIGVEINRQLKDIYAIFVPVGGGGLISGIATFMKQVAPNTKIIGVEPYGAASMTLALHLGYPKKLPWVDNFADDVAVGEVGKYTFQKCNELIDGMVLMHRDGISAGLKDVYDEGRDILETSGALSIAGAEAYCNYYGIKDKNIVAIASGANMDFSKLKLVAELAPIGAGTEALLATIVPEEPGSFLEFIELLGSFSITEFTYRYSSERKHAVFLYSIDLTAEDHPKVEDVTDDMTSAGFKTVDMSHHDLVKEHLRHLVAGGVSNPRDEIFVQFAFPEIQGALNKFLNAFSPRWNITLFHYRSQREIDSSVLVGFQVPQSEMDEFKYQANKLGYPYAFESLDEAAKLIVE